MQKILQDKSLNVAIYCRLSREDGDSIQSSSIINQKELLTEYAEKMSWNIFKVYVDDGYSGGNFNRPGWKALLEDIENGNIDILLTKDLSRLGRNYIEAGYYTEEYFPEKGVRYIAINDNYDSDNEDNDLTPFKNIINQWYLKDISKKVKSVHESRMKKGKLPNGKLVPLYGYKHDFNNERVIDERSASIVRKVFDLYIKGFSTKDIKQLFIKEMIPTPAYFNYLHYNYNPGAWIDVPEDKKYDWNDKVIARILSNAQYTGTLELKKRQTISYKTHKRVLSKPEDIYVFQDRFPVIISKDVWENAKNIRKNRCKARIPFEENPYANFCFCGNCGKVLTLQQIQKSPKMPEGKNYYSCRRETCTKQVNIQVKHIDEILSKEIPSIIDWLLSNEHSLREYAKNYKKKHYSSVTKRTASEKQNIQIRNNKLQILIQKLFERNAMNEIPEEVFQKMMKSYRDELNENMQKLSKIMDEEKQCDNTDYEKQVDEFIVEVKRIKDLPPTKETISCFMEGMSIKRINKFSVNVKFIYKRIANLLEDYYNDTQNK